MHRIYCGDKWSNLSIRKILSAVVHYTRLGTNILYETVTLTIESAVMGPVRTSIGTSEIKFKL